MVAENNNADFVARLNETLDDMPEVPRGRGRRAALARLTGLSGESARKWLSGETLPSMENVRQFSERARVQVEWLLTGRGQKHPYTPPPAHAVEFSAASGPSRQSLSSDIDDLALLASPRTQDVLRQIAQAAREGYLTEPDIELLHQIAERLAQHTTSGPGIYDKLREEARDAHRDTD